MRQSLWAKQLILFSSLFRDFFPVIKSINKRLTNNGNLLGREIFENWIENDSVLPLIIMKNSFILFRKQLQCFIYMSHLIQIEGKRRRVVSNKQSRCWENNLSTFSDAGLRRPKSECLEIKRFNYDFLSFWIKQKTVSKMILWSAHESDKKYGPILMSFFINPRVFPQKT